MSVMVYAIWWAEHGVLKVGRTRTMRRIDALTSTGGEVMVLVRDRAESEERFVIEAMAEEFPRAFTTELSSLQLLPGGRGFTECFRVGGAALPAAIDVVIRGMDRHEHWQAAGDSSGSVDQRGPHRAAVAGEVDGGRPAHGGRRSRPRVDDTMDAAAGPVARRSSDDGGEARDASAEARRGGVHRSVRPRRPRVLRAAAVAAGVARDAVEVPAPAAGISPERLRRPSGELLGYGEREREGAGERRESQRGPERPRGAPVPRRASESVLPRAQAERFRGSAVQALPGRSPRAHPVVVRAQGGAR